MLTLRPIWAILPFMRQPYREIIHTLNMRYYQEFDRAERLAAELHHIRSSRLFRFCTWVRKAFVRRANQTRVDATPFAGTRLTPAAAATGRVSIVIPFRDGYELLRNCLVSLKRTEYSDYEVILVDNGSRERRLLRLLDRLIERPGFQVLRCDVPFNFARLSNAAAHEARGDYLLFLNNDIEVLAADWLAHMLHLAAVPDVGIVGATLLYPDGNIQHAGIFPQSDGSWTHRDRGAAPTRRDLMQPRTVPAVTAACLLIRRAVFAELGGFSEAFPVAGNDVDLCCRVRARGLQVALSPHAKLLHFESLSRGRCNEVAVHTRAP